MKSAYLEGSDLIKLSIQTWVPENKHECLLDTRDPFLFSWILVKSMKLIHYLSIHSGFPGCSVVKKCLQCTKLAGNASSVSGWGRAPGVGNDNPLSILAWEIPWTEEPGGLRSMGLQELDTAYWLNYHNLNIHIVSPVPQTTPPATGRSHRVTPYLRQPVLRAFTSPGTSQRWQACPEAAQPHWPLPACSEPQCCPPSGPSSVKRGYCEL